VGRVHQGRSWFRHRADQRGAALVEAAIILPLLMVLTFGALELGIGFSQKGALESAARGGARKASTATSDPEPMFAQEVANAVNSALDSSAVPKLDELDVYKDGVPGFTPSMCGSPGALCLKFAPDATGKHFLTTYSGQWPDTQRMGCGSNPDQVTVRVVGEFQFLSGLIGKGSVKLTATTTLAFEPTNCP
jgi:hypothetical protein